MSTQINGGWLPRPAEDATPETLRKGIDAVLDLVDQHRESAERFNCYADRAEDKGEEKRAQYLRGQARAYIGAADYIIHALVAALGLWDEYRKATRTAGDLPSLPEAGETT